MKMEMKTLVIASLMVVGLTVGNGMAQTGTASQQSPQMQGNMMNGGMRGNGTGMMNGGMMNGGMMGNGMGMMNGGMMNGGMGCNGMMGGMMMNQMSPQQQQAFMDNTKGLRKKMMETRFTYMEAVRNPKTTPQDLAGIEKQMLELRGQMMEEMGAGKVK